MTRAVRAAPPPSARGPAAGTASLAEADAVALRRRAMDLLARREHSRAELAAKLRERGAQGPGLDAVLDALEADNLLSDERFAETFASQQHARGKGPIAIEHGLRERGVAGSVLAAALANLAADWVALACREREKRFGTEPVTARDHARQARFLRSRGFTGEQVHAVLGGGPGGNEDQ